MWSSEPYIYLVQGIFNLRMADVRLRLEQKLLDLERKKASFILPNGGKSMENQHRKITGYRELSEAEIEIMNRIKEKGKELDRLIGDLLSTDRIEVDARWVNIGKTHLQQGLMALTRAVAKPEFF